VPRDPITPAPAWSSRLRELVTMARYGVVGLGNTALYLVVSLLLHQVGIPAYVAAFLAWCVAATFSFVANQGWTFEVASPRPHASRRFLVVQGASAGTLALGAWGLAELTGMGSFLVQVCVVPWVVAGGYIANRNWVFGPAGAPPAPPTEPPAPA
jgi:putative flippase GtrA